MSDLILVNTSLVILPILSFIFPKLFVNTQEEPACRLVAIHFHPNLKGHSAPNQAMGGVFREN